MRKERLAALVSLRLLYEDFDEVAVLVDVAPQVSTLALYVDDDFVEEPTIATRSL